MFNIVANKPWKSLDVEGFDDLVECQVLTDYTMQETGLKSKKNKIKKRKILKSCKEENEDESSDEENNSRKIIEKNKKINNLNNTTLNLLKLNPNDKTTSKSISNKQMKKNSLLKKDTKTNTKKDPSRIIPKNKKERNKETVKINSQSSTSTKITSNKSSKPTSKISSTDITAESMIRWQGLGVPDDILKCLGEMGFVCPTPVQQATIPSAINNRCDIIAAAATGSGKTLAFGIPIVTHIMEIEKDMEDDDDGEDKDEDEEDEEEDGDDDNDEMDVVEDDSENDDDHVSIGDDDHEDDSEGELKNGKVVKIKESQDDDSEDNDDDDDDDIHMDSDDDHIDSIDDADDDDDDEEITRKNDKKSQMYSLILTPTRELAMQVTQHITNICKYNSVMVTAVVGGIAVEKQQRLLKRRPQIVVATPGRLWQLIQMKEPHLMKINELRHVVVDEVDRMVEKGHFEELQLIIQHLQTHSNMIRRLQVFISSATLAFVHKKPHRVVVMKKKKMKELTLEDKIDCIKKTLKMSSKPKIVDLTQGGNMSSQRLQQLKVLCNIDEKDVMLFHLMITKPDRTLVFANSKDAIRRLTSLFTLLHHHPSIQHPPLPLHSDMSMRQRLKNLDAFKARDTGLLLATDVAARGLDIASVGRVVHYEVPRTAENYVHRSGRTARSDKGGVSVLLVSPQEDVLYRRIMLALKMANGLDDIRIDRSTFQNHQAILVLARKLEVMQYRQKKERVNADWWKQACKDADLVCDDNDVPGGGHDNDYRSSVGVAKRHCEMKMKELMMMMGVTSRKKKSMRQKKNSE